MPRLLFPCAVIALLAAISPAVAQSVEGDEYITALREKTNGVPVVLEHSQRITTRAEFRPPVEITIEAMTDATDLRIGYAADAIIFNWEKNVDELRVDGGPGKRHHVKGAGHIPPHQYVTIIWQVTPGKQMVYVDDELRFEHVGDYSKIDKPVSVSCKDSKVTVKSIKVKQLK